MAARKGVTPLCLVVFAFARARAEVHEITVHIDAASYIAVARLSSRGFEISLVSGERPLNPCALQRQASCSGVARRNSGAPKRAPCSISARTISRCPLSAAVSSGRPHRLLRARSDAVTVRAARLQTSGCPFQNGFRKEVRTCCRALGKQATIQRPDLAAHVPSSRGGASPLRCWSRVRVSAPCASRNCTRPHGREWRGIQRRRASSGFLSFTCPPASPATPCPD